MARLLGPDAEPAALAAASPVCHVHPAAPPFLLAHGTGDDVVAFGQSVAFRDALVSAGVRVRWAPVDGAPHEWADRPGPAEGDFGAMASAFFHEHL